VSRAWLSLTNPSCRVERQRTGRPSIFAASSIAGYSGYPEVRIPNAPPTSPLTTRSFSTGTPIVRATCWRIVKALCEAVCST
jgi:hypothetical protein